MTFFPSTRFPAGVILFGLALHYPLSAGAAGTGLKAPTGAPGLVLAQADASISDTSIKTPAGDGAPAGPGKLDDASGDLPNLGEGGMLSTAGGEKPGSPALRGFVQQETGYTYPSPGHLSTAVIRAQVGSSGQINDNLKWKATLRGDFDPVYAWSDFYPDPARRDQRLYGIIGETYIDTSLKGWDLRLGRQNVVWGEMVGLFFADVVTAKDLRHFILPSFDIIRIPQWAARGEYFFGNDSHLELLWIPYATFDRIGKTGSEFYPFQVPAPAGFANNFRDDLYPDRTLANSNVGARYSMLRNGWDLSGFYYRSVDSAATFYREVQLTGPASGTLVYTPRHDRIWQTGGTVSKDFTDSSVFKAEAVYTSGRSFSVTRLSQPGGVVQKDTIDYAMGLDFTLPEDARFNVQWFQRVFLGHDRDMLQDRFESGATFLYNRKIRPKLEGEILWIQSVNRWENLIRPRLVWKLEANLRVAAGIDIFNGPVTGALGRFADRDRIYVETRYDF